MAHVFSGELPRQSALYERMIPSDFLDCYSVESTLSPRHAAEIITDFPKWAQRLVNLRNAIVTPFGLLKEGPPATDKVGFFPVESDTKNELIAGFNDKHLDFRISIMSQHGYIYLATWVRTNNIGGRLYLKSILPFHTMIVRNALARVKAEKQTGPQLP